MSRPTSTSKPIIKIAADVTLIAIRVFSEVGGVCSVDVPEQSYCSGLLTAGEAVALPLGTGLQKEWYPKI